MTSEAPLPTRALACAEDGCDRPAAPEGRRCPLHANRLGQLPRPNALPVIAEANVVLDAPAPVPLDLPRGPPFLRPLLVSATCVAIFWGALAVALVQRVNDAGLAGLALAGLAALAAALRLLVAAWKQKRRGLAVAAALLVLSAALLPWASLFIRLLWRPAVAPI